MSILKWREKLLLGNGAAMTRLERSQSVKKLAAETNADEAHTKMYAFYEVRDRDRNVDNSHISAILFSLSHQCGNGVATH